MGQEEINKQLELYPYLKTYIKDTIFTDLVDFMNLQTGRKIILGIDKTMSYEFLKRVFNDKVYFNYVSSLLNDKISSLNISLLSNGNIRRTITYDKIQIINGLKWIMDFYKEKLTDTELQNYNTLIGYLSYDNCKKHFKNHTLKLSIDHIQYEVEIIDMFKILELSKQDFYRLCNSKDFKIKNIPIKQFLFATKEFFKSHQIAKNYMLSSSVLENLEDLNKNRIIDLIAFNKYLNTEDTLHTQISVDEALEQSILSDIPENFNSLEKAIYIYLKMCKIFTYDEEFFAMDQKGSSKEKHRHIEYVSNINLTNNKIVCYEFNIIFAYMLNKLGLHFKSFYNNSTKERYGEGHTHLVFRYNKFLIQADAAESIMRSDLTLVKINQLPTGLVLLNQNKDSKKEFEQIVLNVFNTLLKQERRLNDEEFSKEFITILQEYTINTTNLKSITLEERLNILREKIQLARLKGMDTLSYIFFLKKALFSAEHLNKKVSLSVFRNNNPRENTLTASSIGVIVLNEDGVQDIENNQYYIINSEENTITYITKKDLQKLFSNGTYEYVSNVKSIIPGIEGGKRI